jgi:hypothetical protein
MFPNLNLKVPDGAIVPWEDDNSLEILKKFDSEVLGNKLKIVGHNWDPNEPREDGFTKQIARADALTQMKGDLDGWAIQFDADEILRDGDDLKIIQECLEDNKNPNDKRKAFALTGILEFFGSDEKVRFGFGNWLKIRATRNIPEIFHGMPLRMGPMAVRGRNPRTGKMISIENRDDAAGFITSLAFTRPDYSSGLWLFNPQIINMMAQVRNVPDQHKKQAYGQVAQSLIQDMGSGSVWLYHTSWIDIARKWSMGWFFDNFFSVLSGKQDTFIEKAELNGEFTATRCPTGEQLEIGINTEMNRIEIQPLPGIPKPSVFATVAEWRAKNSL